MSFGGTTKFHAGRQYRAKDAPAPAACPPEAAPALAQWLDRSEILVAWASGPLCSTSCVASFR